MTPKEQKNDEKNVSKVIAVVKKSRQIIQKGKKKNFEFNRVHQVETWDRR